MDYKASCTNLVKLTPAEFRQWIDTIDTVLSDCDGVLWNENDVAIDGAATVLNTLRSMGKRVVLVTNNSLRTRADLRLKATKHGHDVEESDIFTSGSAAAAYLLRLRFTDKVYVIGEPAIGQELDAVGIRHCGIGPDELPPGGLAELVNGNDTNDAGGFRCDADVGAVVVGFDHHFSYAKMFKAASYVSQPDGCIFIGTNRDERVRLAGGVVFPEAGPIIASVETTADRQCELVGKPSPLMCATLLEDKENVLVPGRTLMIGDRLDIDVMLGINCGFWSLFVATTGVHSLADAECLRPQMRPDFYLDSLGQMVDLLENGAQ